MKQIRLNAFDMNCVGHIQQGLWTHPRDRSTDYTSLDHWVAQAKLLERGLFDGLFLADILGVYDVYGGNADGAIHHGVQIPVNDPMLLVPAMAHATAHLGFGVTANLSYEPPFTFARRMSTLDHLTRGRIGWNVVTGYLDSAARAMGLDRQMAHDDRYDMADEYMQVVYKLWEASWDGDAVLRDRAAGVYADPAKVRAIAHEGRQYRVNAIHLSEPSPQRTPVLYQAGSSGRGKLFAATHAECVFVNGQARASVRRIVDDIRAGAVAQGRAPDDVRVFVGCSVVVAETEALAQAKFADYRRYASSEGALVHAAASLGIDLAAYGEDQPIEMVQTQAIQSNLEALTTRNPGPAMTKRRLRERMVLGSRQAPMVGSADQVAEELIAWISEADVDGFILSRTVSPECFEDFVELVVPALQRRGAYKEAYAPGTLREKLFGQGPHLSTRHPARKLAAIAA
jgi:FMN-dependent oxidoreductase (nitrilotriacetate monooxygenase family)